MTERSVSVKLKLLVKDYVAGGAQAIATNKAITASAKDTVGAHEKASAAATKFGKTAEGAGRSGGRGLMFAAAGVSALGASGGALKVLPPLLTATATTAAALPGAMLGAASGVGVLVVASRNLGDAFKEVDKQSGKDPFKKLAPNARALVSEYARMKPMLTDMQRGFQQRAFKGTQADLGLIMKTLPQVSGNLNKIADDWADMFAEIALSVSSPEAVGAFNTITASADHFFDGVTARVRPTSRAIASLLTSADPVARAFGDGLLQWLDRFNAGVAKAQADGSLARLFEQGAQSAHELMSITGDVLRITGMVVKEASASNSATEQAGASLRAYVASGDAAEDVAGVVHTLTTAWEGLRDVLGPIGQLVREALADPATAASIGQFFTMLAMGSQTVVMLLSVLLELNSATGGVLLAAVGLALAISKVVGVVNLATAATTKGAAALTRYGVAGTMAGRAMTGLTAGAGKAAGAFLALEVAHQVMDAFQNDTANVEKLDAAIKNLAQTGQVAGELKTAFDYGFGDMATQANMASADGVFSNLLRNMEKAVPLTGDLAQLFGSPSFTQSADNFAALDASVSKYASTSNDLNATTRVWNSLAEQTGLYGDDLAKLLPSTYAELQRMQEAAHNAGSGVDELAARTKLLNAPLTEAITLGRDLIGVFTELNGGALGFGKAQNAAEASIDELNKTLDKNGLTLDANGEKGRANREALFGVAEAAAKAAQAKMDETGSVEQAAGVYDGYIQRLRASLIEQGYAPAKVEALIGAYAQMPASLEAAGQAANTLNQHLNSIPKGTKFEFNGDSIVNGAGQVLELAGGIKGLPAGKSFTWNGKNLVDSTGKVYALKSAISGIPNSKTSKISTPGIDPATGKVEGLAGELQGLPDGIASIQVNAGGAMATIRQVRQSLANLGGAIAAVPNRAGGAYIPRQRGGVTAAAGGLLQPEIAPPGTRYQWAEPETGGELFLPRRGDRARGRQLLGVAADWYDMRVMPMRMGGYNAAASGLVNVAPKDTTTTTTTKATRLDYAEAYLRAREAVKGLNASLKENGKSFSVATKKGQENRSAVYAGIRAAQEAARTKFEETGSVAKANQAYDQHIARLKATLKQQKVNSATIKALMALASRPTYDVPKAPAAAPTNSLANIATAKAAIGAADGLVDLRDKLSLNRVGVGMGTDYGRENLGNIIGFLESAASLAQARYEQTKSAKTATADYDKQIAALRTMLTASGYPKATIDSLLKTYGRITLTPNLRGGVYAANGLATLDRAQLFPAGSTPMYGFAERATGGEAFIPRFGDQRRGRDLVDVAAGWYGGRFSAGGQGSSQSSYDYSTHLTVQPLTYNPTPAELAMHQRQLDARARVGRPR